MELVEKLRHVLGFPKDGIDFIDITTLLKDADAFREALDRLSATADAFGEFDYIVSPEARGFLLGAPLAYMKGKGFVPIRKAGKLPAETVSMEYDLEYGTEKIEIHKDALVPGDRVLVVDDLLATGGTSLAAIELLEKLGAKIVGVLFLIELEYLDGFKQMEPFNCKTLIKISE